MKETAKREATKFKSLKRKINEAKTNYFSFCSPKNDAMNTTFDCKIWLFTFWIKTNAFIALKQQMKGQEIKDTLLMGLKDTKRTGIQKGGDIRTNYPHIKMPALLLNSPILSTNKLSNKKQQTILSLREKMDKIV